VISTDEMERIVDRRATQAASDLHRVTATRPLVEVRMRRQAPRRALLSAACIVVLVVGGLFVINGRTTPQQMPASPNGIVVWTIGDLPAGWTVGAVRSYVGTPADFVTADFAVYGTDAVPDGPVIALFRSSPAQTQLPGSSGHGFVESTIGDRRLVLADGEQGQGDRLAWVEVGTTWVTFEARNTSDDVLRAMAAAVTLDASGRPTIDVAGLPDGIAVLGSGAYSAVAPAFWGGLVGQGSTVATTSIDYLGPDGVGATLTETVAVPSELAMIALRSSSIREIDLDGTRAWVAVLPGLGHAVTWQRDGTTLLMTGMALSDDQMVDLARSVRRAQSGDLTETSPTETEGTTLAAGTELQQEGEAVDTVPPPVAPSSDEILDATIDIARTVVSPNEITLAAQLDEGFEFDIDVSVVADAVRLKPRANGQDMGQSFGRPSPKAAEQLTIFGSGGGIIAMALTDNPDAAMLEVVRSTGQRYTVELTFVPAHPEIRLAGLVMPDGQLVSARLLDTDGAVLAESNL
jgi:hypothetical protein